MDERECIMYRGIWYGEIPNNTSKDQLWKEINKEGDERKRLLYVIDLLKLGDFKAKRLLIQIMNESKDDAVKNLCIRVFLSVANHEDIANVYNLGILSDCSDDIINMFATYSKQALSYEVVPYLLALLEEWDDTYVETSLRDALQDILNYQEIIPENSNVQGIGDFYINNKVDTEWYYYKGQLAFPGTLTKILLDASAISRKTGKELNEIVIPTMLSIWSGIKCPVEYYTIVDDELMRRVFDYIKQLSKMNWEKGCKYFYGNKI